MKDKIHIYATELSREIGIIAQPIMESDFKMSDDDEAEFQRACSHVTSPFFGRMFGGRMDDDVVTSKMEEYLAYFKKYVAQLRKKYPQIKDVPRKIIVTEDELNELIEVTSCDVTRKALEEYVKRAEIKYKPRSKEDQQ